MQRIQLGVSGVEVSRLAIGTGTNGGGQASDQTRKGTQWISGILSEGLKHGVTFWDLADLYGSHPEAAVQLKQVSRSSVQIVTKTLSLEYTACESDVKRFLKELGTDYLDILLLHGVTSAEWQKEREGAKRALSEAKEQGLVRAVGVSCHSLSALMAASTEPWVDVIFTRINYRGDEMDDTPNAVVPVIRRAYENGKGIVGMKVYGCGALTGDKSKAVQFVMGLGCVHAATIGPSEDRHLLQNIRLVEEAETINKPSTI